jgi:hypothetical protein
MTSFEGSRTSDTHVIWVLPGVGGNQHRARPVSRWSPGTLRRLSRVIRSRKRGLVRFPIHHQVYSPPSGCATTWPTILLLAERDHSVEQEPRLWPMSEFRLRDRQEVVLRREALLQDDLRGGCQLEPRSTSSSCLADLTPLVTAAVGLLCWSRSYLPPSLSALRSAVLTDVCPFSPTCWPTGWPTGWSTGWLTAWSTGWRGAVSTSGSRIFFTSNRRSCATRRSCPTSFHVGAVTEPRLGALPSCCGVLDLEVPNPGSCSASVPAHSPWLHWRFS